jgi:hypothetical protein
MCFDIASELDEEDGGDSMNLNLASSVQALREERFCVWACLGLRLFKTTRWRHPVRHGTTAPIFDSARRRHEHRYLASQPAGRLVASLSQFLSGEPMAL